MGPAVGRRLRLAGIYLAATILVVVVLGPLLYIVSIAIRPTSDLYLTPFAYFPPHPTADNFLNVLLNRTTYKGDFGAATLRSLAVASSATLIALSFASLAGYSLARFRFRGREAFGMGILATQMMPAVLFLVPLFITLRQLQLINTLQGLVVAYLTFAMPYCTWTLRSYFERIPVDIEEAALIDGCNRLQTLWFVIVPVARPALVATGIFAFILAWNEFLFAFVLAGNNPVVTSALYSFIGQYGIEYTNLMAGAVIVSVPPLLLFLVLQRYLVEGLSTVSTR